MKLKFLSICSGIEAASVAFHPLGWQALAFAEIEPFPCAVLAHHYPHIPNLGDLTRWRTWPSSLLVQVELLCGGTPCQAFSVAGLRNSLADARGNLTLIFCELYAHINTLRRAAGLPPALLLWENVPGVLNTPDNAFGCFLAGIAGESDALQPPGGRWENAGYVSGPEASAAYRTLDAQYFGLAQRRRRVFVVASPDPAFDPAAVLFEFTGLRRDTPPSRRTRQDTAPTLSARTKGGGGLGTDADADLDGACIVEKVESQAVHEIAGTLSANGKAAGSATQQDADQGMLIPVAFGGNNTSGPIDQSPALNANRGCHNPGDFESGTLLLEVTHSLRAEGHDASIVPIGPHAQAYRTSGNCGAWPTGEKIDALTTGTDRTSHLITQEPFAFDLRGRDGGAMPEGPHATAAMRASSGGSGGSGGSSRSYVASPQAVAFKPRHYRADRKDGAADDVTGPLTANTEFSGDCSPHVAYNAQSFNAYQRTIGDVASPIMAGDSKKVEIGGLLPPETIQHQESSIKPLALWRVRRLTPEECEILQGFPIGYTLIPGHSPKKRKGTDLTETIAYLISLGIPAPDATLLAHSPDGPRYKALGNSWAVPCARWIAHRMAAHLAQLSHDTLPL